MFFLTGVARYLFGPLAEAVVFALLASYFFSRTFIPTLVMCLMRAEVEARKNPESEKQSGFFGRIHHRFEHGFEALREKYSNVLTLCLEHRRAPSASSCLAWRVSRSFHRRDFPRTCWYAWPDIAEADRFVALPPRRSGRRTADLPQLSLTGFAGFESVALASLFSWQNSIASLGASAVTPLFNGGRNRAGVDQARAAFHGSLAQYEKAVLTVYQEVEDQLAALRILSDEAQSQADAVADAVRAEGIAMNRFQTGLSAISTC
jgi:hypothetical protein